MLKLIKTTVLDASAASVTIDNIPQQFKSLKLVVSARTDRTGGANWDGIKIALNGSTPNVTSRNVYGLGSGTPGSDTNVNYALGGAGTAANTASTFSSMTVEFPNYASTTTYKPISVDSVNENNGTSAMQMLVADLYSSNSAITSIYLVPEAGPNFVAGSTFYLYGVS